MTYNRFRPGYITAILVFLTFLGQDSTGLARESVFPGRKYLLSVGINQYESKPLKGCINDAAGMKDMLVDQFGFEMTGATLLTDQSATRERILGEIERYIQRVSEGDLFVFFFSGHGTIFPDINSEELDESEILDLSWLRAQGLSFPDGRYDSSIVPIDSDNSDSGRPWKNLILDDELYVRFSRMTEKGASVILISDSCNSGSLAKSLGEWGTPKFIDPEIALKGKISFLPVAKSVMTIRSRNFHGRYLAITSSHDNQLSFDGIYEGRPQGRFTFALKKVIARSGWSISYRDVYSQTQSLIDRISSGTQAPVMDSRFYKGRLDVPIFSLIGNQNARLRIIIRSRNGDPIQGSSFALFPPEIESIPNQVRLDNTLVVLRTGVNGEAISEMIELPSKDCLIKAVGKGFSTFSGRVRAISREGTVTLLIVLDPE